MTLPFEPALNPPPFCAERDAEHKRAERELLAAKLTAACQAIIQAASMIASDDNPPDPSMTWEEAQDKLRVLDKAVMDLQRPVVDWTFPNTESAFWANKLKGAP